ncbi:MAG: ribonucleotide monophosphatase NagD (HAD superfamily), partial [Bacteroidia bacterium]
MINKFKYFVLATACLFGMSLSIQATESSVIRTDTVFIELGENKKIAIVVDDKDDLKNLEKYDLNKMITDLNQHADTVVFKNQKKYEFEDREKSHHFFRKRADIDFSIANYDIEIES